MATELKDPNDDGILEFTQTVEDVDGDSLSISLELDEINGTTQSGTDREPNWLSFTTSSSLQNDGTRIVDIKVEVDASELAGAGTTYSFVLVANDGITSSTCSFTLEVKSQFKSATDLWQGENGGDGDGSIENVDLSNATFTSEVDNLNNVLGLHQRGTGNIFALDWDGSNFSVHEYKDDGSKVGSTTITANLPTVEVRTGSVLIVNSDGTYLIVYDDDSSFSFTEPVVEKISADGSSSLARFRLNRFSPGGIVRMPNGNILATGESKISELDEGLSTINSASVSDIGETALVGREGKYITVGGNDGLFVFDSNFNQRWSKTNVNYRWAPVLGDYIVAWDTTNRRWIVYDKNGNQQTTISSALSNIEDVVTDQQNKFAGLSNSELQIIDGTSEQASSNSPFGGQTLVMIIG